MLETHFAPLVKVIIKIIIHTQERTRGNRTRNTKTETGLREEQDWNPVRKQDSNAQNCEY